MNLYEKYHSDRKNQLRVIGKGDFTYHSLINLIEKYTKNKNKFLDIGCGVGTIDFYILKLGKEVVGIDISKNGISVAKKNAFNLGFSKRLKFQILDFSKELPNGKFDVIICSEVLEHLKNDTLAVKKIKSILQKDGIIIASSPSQNAPLYRMGMLNKFDREVGHLRRYTEKSYRRTFEESGLEILETKKTEGILRNFLFTNPFGGFLLRVLNKWPFSDAVTFLDNITIPIFGESDIFLVARKK